MQDSIDSVNNNFMKKSDTTFSRGDYIKVKESLFRSEGFGEVLEQNGSSYICLVNFIELNPLGSRNSKIGSRNLKKLQYSKEPIRSENLIRITEKEYQEGILIQKNSIAHYQKLNKYWEDSKHDLVLLGDILKNDYPDKDSFKSHFKEIISMKYDEIFSFEKLSLDQQQEITKKSMHSAGYTHEQTAKLIILTQQYILSTISKQLKADELRIIADICTEKQNNQIEFCQGINEGLKNLDYTHKKGFILVILGIIIILMIPALALHLRIGSFIFGPLFIIRGLYILIKVTLNKKSK